MSRRVTSPFGLLLLLSAFLALGGAPAAAFDVQPSSCHVRLGQTWQFNVYSTDNPNATTIEVPYGPDNIILQAPNFRAGQPTEFPPGRSEGLWATQFNYVRTPTVTWYLQGLTAANGDPCSAPGAPQNVVPPSIEGTPNAGASVTLDPGTWTGGSVIRTHYRVDVCGPDGCAIRRPLSAMAAISGPVSYTIPSGLRGKRLRLTVAAHSTRGVATAASALTAPVVTDGAAASPTTTRVPGTSDEEIQIIGDRAAVPVTQQAWDGLPEPDIAHQWQRCAPTCVDIPGDTGIVHRIVDADVGTSLRVVTTADNGVGTATWTSQERSITEVPSAPTAPIPLVAPRLTSGTAGVGLPVRAELGSWVGDADPELQWQRCDATACTDIAGATDELYTPVEADADLSLRAVVTGRNDDVTGSGLLPAGFTAATDVSSAVTRGPINLSPPRIDGSGDVGVPLELADAGSWSAELDAAAIAWERCRDAVCEPITGAVGDTYVPSAGDAGADVRAVVAARTAGGVTQAASAPIGPIGRVRSIAAPSITVDGSYLVASLGDWVATPLPGFAVQWLTCDAEGDACTELPGATSVLYSPAADDAGRTLRVRVRAANGFSADEQVSAASETIGRRADPPAPQPPSSAPDRDRIAPRLASVRLSPRRFRVGRGRTALSAARRRGSSLTFALSEDAWLRIDVRRAARRRHPIGTLTRVASAGTGAIRFTGRLGRKPLRPGRYVATVRATDAAGNRSAPRSVRFRILRR